MIDKQNNKIDELLNIRNQGMINYSKSTGELIKLGVKIGKNLSGNLTIPNSFSPYLEKYNRSNMEFEWQVRYKSGTFVDQYTPGGKVHHYGNIDQDKLKSISYISNFTWPTDNVEKKIIVTLDWENGLFSIMNGFADQKTKEHLCMSPLVGEKKLILFLRKRESKTSGELNSEYKEFALPTQEFFYYNRFVLGYQAGTEKKMCIIEPNGNIKIFKN